ncbi:hypothetical protein C8R44DRAFT_751228 [Mycena epipterygia]|nr:hypothetical protein C8R44DRAFT_751228 [Mycena epipterygia]
MTFNSEAGSTGDDTPTASRGSSAITAENTLHLAQPFPGDDACQTEKRFLIYQVSDSEHIVMDNKTDQDVLIRTEYLLDPCFDLGSWYADQRRSALAAVPASARTARATPPSPSAKAGTVRRSGGRRRHSTTNRFFSQLALRKNSGLMV